MACPNLDFNRDDHELLLTHIPDKNVIVMVYLQKIGTGSSCEFNYLACTSSKNGKNKYSLSTELTSGDYRAKATILIGEGPKVYEANEEFTL